MKYRKKPVVIEAFQYIASGDTNFQFWELCQHFGNPDCIIEEGNQVFIKTLEGKMHVSSGDYVIKGLQGEFYPCKPDIFEKSYEPVNEG